MTRVIELTVWVALLAAAPALAQSRPQTPPPPPPGVNPQPVGRRQHDGTGIHRRDDAPRRRVRSRRHRRPTRLARRPPRRRPPPLLRAPPVVPTETAPTTAQLGLPIYPGATFLRSFDAGQGQRYYLFGSTASFAEVVKYYRTQLKDGGDLVYDVPPVHMFEVGRFREETMAFPPGVTVKDYTWGTAKGYLVPTPGANPSRFPTVIQIVPVLPANK